MTPQKENLHAFQLSYPDRTALGDVSSTNARKIKWSASSRLPPDVSRDAVRAHKPNSNQMLALDSNLKTILTYPTFFITHLAP